MNHRWAARGLVVALHLALFSALWLHRPPLLQEAGERRVTTVRLLAPPKPPRPNATTERAAPVARPMPAPALPTLAPLPFTTEGAAPITVIPAPPPTAAAPAEPSRAPLRLTLPPSYAASSAAARNPALSDPRSNTPRPTLEDRIADATGGAGAWVEESTSENRSQEVGAQGGRRTVMRRGDTCVEIFRSRIADMDNFNGNVAPRAMSMMGKPYKCK
jgi:hypothetical protein